MPQVTREQVARLIRVKRRLFWAVDIKERDEREGLRPERDIPGRKTKATFKRNAGKGQKRSPSDRKVKTRASSANAPIHAEPIQLDYTPNRDILRLEKLIK